MTRRKLRRDELELWQKVAHTTKPLPETVKRPAPLVEKRKPGAVRDPVPPATFDLPARHPSRNEGHLPVSPPARKQGPAMDKKTFGRMRRGKLVPEARIDLHGMTLDQAHPSLTRFILTSHARGLRLVLVITGKGRRDDGFEPVPRQRGALKRQVPMWLRMAPLNTAVLEVSEAHVSHGGGGAYYVYLRRNRG